MTMTDQQRVDALKEYVYQVILPDMGRPDFTIEVVTFGEGSALRVAELGYNIKGDPGRGDRFIQGGASWMRADLESAPVILAAEIYLLDVDQEPAVFHGSVEDQYDPTFLDVRQEAEYRLWDTLAGDKARETGFQWQHHWPRGTELPEGVTGWHDPEKQAAYEAVRVK